jgi:leader peptidase (prepilin peptidase)/N-methyltransferase
MRAPDTVMAREPPGAKTLSSSHCAVYGFASFLLRKAMGGTVDFLCTADWAGPLVASPFLGSFMGVLIVRVPAGRNVAAGRSCCDACGHTLGVAELVPIASFLALRGRCLWCHAPIPRVTIWVELAALAVALTALAAGERGALLWAGCGLGWTLLTLGWIDALCERLPDFLTLPLVLAGLAEAYFLEPEALTSRASGAACGYAGFRLLSLMYKRWRGQEGLGEGDAKLLAAGGAWAGAWLLSDILLVAAVTALVFTLRHGRVDRYARIPFGPFLAAGTWLIWLIS